MNVFVVSGETLLRSQKDKRFSLDCWYPLPSYKYGLLVHEWCCDQVFFDELTFDVELQRVYHFDYESRLSEMNSQRIADEVFRQRETLRERFESFWLRDDLQYDSEDDEVNSEWMALKNEMRSVGFVGALPNSHWSMPFYGVIALMLSVKYGKPVGYKFKTLLEVTNLAFNSYKKFLRPFGLAIYYYDMDDLLVGQDRKGTWRKRKVTIRQAMVAKDPAYAQTTFFDEAIAFILPKISDKLGVSCWRS